MYLSYRGMLPVLSKNRQITVIATLKYLQLKAALHDT